MSETVNIKIIFQSIIEIICTILGLDKINNKKIEFTTSSNSQNIDNNTDKLSIYDLFNHSMKSYNDFMGTESLTNVKNNDKSNNVKNNEKSNNEKSNQYIKEDTKKKATMPVWAKTTK